MNLNLKLKSKKWIFEKQSHRAGSGIQYRFKFENGYAASVVKFTATPFSMGGSYGVEFDLWELAVLKDGELHYNNPVAKGDVRGYLKDEDVEKLLNQIKKFKK